MNTRIKSILAGTALSCALPLAANADLPGKHPYYLHALSDLRAARWMLEHRPGDAAVSGQEDVAINEVDAAIAEIKKASIDDGKDLHDHEGVTDVQGQAGRLHKALDLLRKTHEDTAREEHDPAVKGLRDRATQHIDGAIGATKRAIGDIEHHQ